MCYCYSVKTSATVLFSEATVQEERASSHGFNFTVTYFHIMLLVILQTACHFYFL